MPVEYYEKTIYPLQDRVLQPLKQERLPFYLSGGTALSRGYYHHRYSDDLDLFVNDRDDFNVIVDRYIKELKQISNDLTVAMRSDRFCRLFIFPQRLKIELVNDVPSHIGSLLDHPQLGAIDSKENILANKITSIIDRKAPKDVVDIYFLLKDGLDISDALLNAESKSAGISALYLAKVLSEFKYDTLKEGIIWKKETDIEEIRKYLRNIAHLLVGVHNDISPS